MSAWTLKFSRGIKKKKIPVPLYGQVLSLPPPTGSFLLLRVWLQTFFPNPFKGQHWALPPQSPGTTEGADPGGRRPYVTHHAQETSRWERKMQRGRKRSLCLKGALRFWRKKGFLKTNKKERKKLNSRGEKTVPPKGNAFKSIQKRKIKKHYSQQGE